MSNKLNNRITLSQAARLLEKTPSTLSRQLKRHGVTPDAGKRYSTAQVLEAAAQGAESDKRNLSQADAGDGSLVSQRVRMQIKRLGLECQTAQFRLAQLRGQHVPLADYERDVKAVYQAAIQTVDFWIKTTAAAIGTVDMKRRLESARRQAYAAIQAELESATESATEPESEL